MTTKRNMLVGVIADRETTVCFLLAGIGEQKADNKNFLIVDEGLSDENILKFLDKLYNRKDICVILIGHDVARRIDSTLKTYTKDLPIIMKIPSKSYLEQLSGQPGLAHGGDDMSDIFQFS